MSRIASLAVISPIAPAGTGSRPLDGRAQRGLAQVLGDLAAADQA